MYILLSPHHHLHHQIEPSICGIQIDNVQYHLITAISGNKSSSSSPLTRISSTSSTTTWNCSVLKPVVVSPLPPVPPNHKTIGVEPFIIYNPIPSPPIRKLLSTSTNPAPSLNFLNHYLHDIN